MGIRFRCHHCEHRLNIKAELAGRRGICPECDGRFRIPLIDQDFSDSISGTSSDSLTNAASSATVKAITNGSSAQALRKVSSKHSSNTSTVRTKQIAQPSRDASKNNNAALYMVKPPGGGVYGPADLATIRSWIAEYRITADTNIAPVGSSQWVLAEVYFPNEFD